VARAGADVFLTDFHPQGYEQGWRRTFRHSREVVEVQSISHTMPEICREFELEGFSIIQLLEPYLGAPEIPIFERQGKTHLFDRASRVPAIFVCRLKRTDGDINPED
jgi:hypothetical protein